MTISYNTRPPVGEPVGAVVLFHGRGASETDLEPLLEVLDPGRRLWGLFPRGPLSLPPGGAHWYIVREIGFPDTETFTESYEAASEWLDVTLAELGVAPDQTLVGGFSQGAVMSYALGLGAGRPRPAGILAMSGFVPTVEGFELDLASRTGLPVAISHGRLDPIIHVQFGRAAADLLSEAGLDVRYAEGDDGHTVSSGALVNAHGLVSNVFASA